MNSGNHHKQTSDKKTISELDRLMNPILVCMKLTGIYFEGSGSSQGRFWPWYSLLLTFTSYLYVLSSVAPIIIFIQQLSFDEVVVSVMPAIYVFQNCLNFSIHYYACARGGFYPALFQRWKKIALTDAERDELWNYIHKMTIRVTGICLGLTIFFIAAWTALLMGWIPGFYLDPYPAFRLFSPMVATMQRAIAIIFCNVTMACWFFSCGIFVLLCLITDRAFEQLNDQILHDVNLQEKSKPTSDLEFKGQLSIASFRNRHHRIVAVVNCIDEHLGLFILTEFTNYMALLCVDAYVMLLLPSDGLTKVMGVSWSVVTAGILGVLTYAASIVNISAHVSNNHLSRLNGRHLSASNLVQLSVLLARVSGPDIGITAWGLFVITKGFLLTLLSAFVTYFFLLLQFNSSPTGNSGKNRCSNLTLEHLLANLTQY